MHDVKTVLDLFSPFSDARRRSEAVYRRFSVAGKRNLAVLVSAQSIAPVQLRRFRTYARPHRLVSTQFLIDKVGTEH